MTQYDRWLGSNDPENTPEARYSDFYDDNDGHCPSCGKELHKTNIKNNDTDFCICNTMAYHDEN